MPQNKRSFLVCLLVMAAVLAFGGAAVAAAAEAPATPAIKAGGTCNAGAAANIGMPEPIDLQRLNPDCCRSISSTPEATCDSVSWSEARCNQYNGGGQCAWICSCCQPISAAYSFAYCAQFDPLGPDRCNQVWQGTACAWTC